MKTVTTREIRKPDRRTSTGRAPGRRVAERLAVQLAAARKPDTAHLLELVTAERNEAVRYLRQLLAMSRGNEFAWAPEQAALRGAAALVAEIEGRK